MSDTETKTRPAPKAAVILTAAAEQRVAELMATAPAFAFAWRLLRRPPQARRDALRSGGRLHAVSLPRAASRERGAAGGGESRGAVASISGAAAAAAVSAAVGAAQIGGCSGGCGKQI